MSLLHDALRAGLSPTPTSTPTSERQRRAAHRPPLVLAGAAGPLGAAVLEAWLAEGAQPPVSVLVRQPLQAAVQGLRPVRWPSDGPLPASGIVLLDRGPSRHGRDDAYVQPTPDTLAALAQALHHQGVRHLLVVLPHAPASLPEALKRGLASLDEQAVAATGFEHLVIVRSAEAPPEGAAPDLLHRLARLMLSQLRFMVPPREQWVRTQSVAEFVVRLASELPHAAPGTRVVPPEVVWEAAQSRDVGAAAHRWLHGGTETDSPHPRGE